MLVSDYSLIIFSLAIQLSVGLIILFNTFIYWPAFNSRGTIQRMLKSIPLLALAIGIIGVLFSFLHLGHPMKAFKAINHFETSWLSKEIIFLSLYLGFLILFILVTWTTTSWKRIQKVLLDLCSIAGIILIYSMSKLYMLPAQPNWNSVFTFVSFYGSSLLLASPLLLLLITKKGSYSSQRALAVLNAALIIIALILLPVFINFLQQNGIPGQQAMDLLLGSHSLIFFGKILLQIVALILIFRSLFVIRSEITQCRQLTIPISLTFASLLIAQYFGRALFYALALSEGGF